MIEHGYKAHVEMRLYEDSFVFYMRHAEGQKVSRAVGIEFEEIEEGVAIESPFLRLQPEEAQQFVDAMWDAGLRPTKGRQSEEVTAAQANHLSDMRAIAFGKLNIPAPGE